MRFALRLFRVGIAVCLVMVSMPALASKTEPASAGKGTAKATKHTHKAAPKNPKAGAKHASRAGKPASKSGGKHPKSGAKKTAKKPHAK
jgi:hypothetical protein